MESNGIEKMCDFVVEWLSFTLEMGKNREICIVLLNILSQTILTIIQK